VISCKRYSRMSISAVLIIICIGLVSLGVRLPSSTGFSSSSKPKPRPRAIIQTQIKTCKEKICQQINTALVDRIFSFNYSCLVKTIDLIESPVCNDSVLASLASSRAPPLLYIQKNINIRFC